MIQSFKSSYKELKNLRTLTGISLLLALEICLGYFKITLSESLWISPAFIATGIMGMMFGPVATGMGAGVADILKYLSNPRGAYFPGFTLSAVIGGIIYGLVFYKKKVTPIRAVTAKAGVNIVCNIILNTVWVHFLYRTPVPVLLATRISKNLILLVPEAIILYVVIKALQKATAKSGYQI